MILKKEKRKRKKEKKEKRKKYKNLILRLLYTPSD